MKKLTYGIFLIEKITKAIANLEALDLDVDHVIPVAKILKVFAEERTAFEKAKQKKILKFATPDMLGNVTITAKNPGYREFVTFLGKLSKKEFEVNFEPLDRSVLIGASGKISTEDIDILAELGILTEEAYNVKDIDVSDIDEPTFTAKVDEAAAEDSSVKDLDVAEEGIAPESVRVEDSPVAGTEEA